MANPSAEFRHSGTVAAVGRWVSAVILSALAGGIAFLIVVQWAEGREYTDLDFNHSLGVLIGGAGTQARTDAALGVSGDTAAPTGLIWFSVISILVMTVYGLTVHRWMRRPWYVQGLPLAGVVFLLVMLVYMPLVDSSAVEDVSVGVLGLDAGSATPFVFAAGALVYGILGARVFSLAASPEWWRVREVRAEDALAQIEGMEALNVEPLDPDRRRGGGGMVPPSGS
jgi:hypothetical protein